MHRMTRVVFMGSPEFAVPSLRALHQNFSVCGVVTMPDRPAGRGREPKPPAVKRLAQELGLPILQPENVNAPDSLASLEQWMPDVVVVAAFGQILRRRLLDLPRHGCLNVHASLLPRWRGAAPIQAAILAGDSETGITIMKMDEGLDTGPILAQMRCAVEVDDTAGSLAQRMAEEGAALLVKTMPPYLAGKLPMIPQPAEGATKAPMLRKSDGLLDFRRPAEELERLVRALNPWPGAYVMWQGGPLKVHRAHVEKGEAPPGTRLIRGGRPAIGANGSLFVLDEVQPAGRRSMDGRAFLRGARHWEGQGPA
jgi:methionyl-tRNA formyltransferase